jgi:hypothetical protein
MSVAETLAQVVQIPTTVIPAAGNTNILDLFDVEGVKRMRILLKNSGANAFDVAQLQGSMDGIDYSVIDAANFTTAFGTLAAAAVGSIFEDNLHFKYLRILLSAAAGGASVIGSVTLIYN